jgi:hypothetical protein
MQPSRAAAKESDPIHVWDRVCYRLQLQLGDEPVWADGTVESKCPRWVRGGVSILCAVHFD